MKILLVGPYFPDSAVYHIEKALRNLGHDVKLFTFKNEVASMDIINRLKAKIKYYSPMTRPIFTHFINKALIKEASRYSPDLILIMKGDIITPQTLGELKNNCEASIVNWFPDNPMDYFKESIDEIVSAYDFFFIVDSFAVNKLNEEGFTNVKYLPWCTAPDINRTIELNEKEIEKYACDVCMVGSYYPYRLRFIRELTGFDLGIWGLFWHRLDKNSVLKKFYRGGPIWLEEKAKVFNASKIILNPHHPQAVHGTNRRVFDATSCGGFVLTDKKSDYEKLFKIGKELVWFEDIGDMVEKVKYYLSNPEERIAIAKKGQIRSQRDHTFVNRMKELMSVIEC